MGRAKIARKSTTVDMTAMCDVAFLLLAFFILATKFKPTEALKVTTPNSVSSKIAPEKDVVMITMDKDGKVYLSVSDANETQKQDMLDAIAQEKNISLTPAEKANFVKNPSSFIGVPFAQLKSFLDINPEELDAGHVKLPGIPTQDSTNNELIEWIRVAVDAFQGRHMNILVKGDNDAKYPSFDGVVIALKKNDQMKFEMVTNPVAAPLGSELQKAQAKTGSKSSDE